MERGREKRRESCLTKKRIHLYYTCLNVTSLIKYAVIILLRDFSLKKSIINLNYTFWK